MEKAEKRLREGKKANTKGVIQSHFDFLKAKR